MTEHDPQAKEIARRWLRKQFQIGVSAEDPRLNSILEETAATIDSMLSMNQKRKFGKSIPRQIEQLQAELRKLISPDADTKEKYPTLSEGEMAQKLDEIITKMETGFARIEKQMHEQGSSTGVPSFLFSPFEILRNNQGNTHRNHHRNFETHGAGASLPMHAFQFAFALAPRRDFSKKDGEASYSPQSNIVTLADDFDPESEFDLFLAYHELQHVRQFQEMIMKIGPQNYFQFVSDTTNYFPHFEVEAWALQLEAMNSFLHDGLRNSASRPHAGSQTRRFLGQLNGKTERYEMMESLLKASKLFFPHGIRNDQVSPSFSFPLATSYVNGKRHWKFNRTTGAIVPLEAGDDCHKIH